MAGGNLTFSQRMGLTPITKAIQSEGMDNFLRIALWNALTDLLWSRYYTKYEGAPLYHSNFQNFVYILHRDFFKRTTDTVPGYWNLALSDIKNEFFRIEWFRVYDFLEFAAANAPHKQTTALKAESDSIIPGLNAILEAENSAFRFVNGQISTITSTEEIQEIESAYTNSSPYAGVQVHLKTALGFLTDRQSPDYRNSIKESISAVESLAKQLVGVPSATLDGALKVLEKSHKLHPALKKAFSSLYGYTNDSDGIRHALMENSELTKADARFMLICCSAFINFAIDSVED
jgi:hypothetical protein